MQILGHQGHMLNERYEILGFRYFGLECFFSLEWFWIFFSYFPNIKNLSIIKDYFISLSSYLFTSLLQGS